MKREPREALRAVRDRWPALAGLLLSLVLGPAAWGADPSQSWWRPVKDVSAEGHRAIWLFWYVTWLCIAAFGLVVIALVTFALKYRARPGARAFYDHGTNRQAFFVTLGAAVIVFVTIDMQLVRYSQRDIKEFLFNWPTSADTVRVEVMPQQWAWNFRYPGPDGKFNTDDDVVTLNDLRVPVDKPVMLNLKAKDVIHSLYLPSLRIKHDANPGYVTRMWFTAKESGKYEIACSQMCGWAHYKMRGEMTVLADADYQRWLKDAEADAQRRHDPADKDINWGWEWVQ